MLILPIKGKWFDMIRSLEKPEEYREFSEYYATRFAKLGIGDGSEHYVKFRNGYGRYRPTLLCKVKIFGGRGNSAWGAVDGVYYFILRILSVEDATEPETEQCGRCGALILKGHGVCDNCACDLGHEAEDYHQRMSGAYERGDL